MTRRPITEAEEAFCRAALSGRAITHADVCALATTLVDLKFYEHGLKYHGRLSGEAMGAIARRRHDLSQPGARDG